MNSKIMENEIWYNNVYLFYRKCLLRSLRNCVLILEFVRSKGVEVRFHGRGKNEASHYCRQCEVRFDLTFVILVFQFFEL